MDFKAFPKGKHYIDGNWIQGTGDSFSSINPANGKTIWNGTNATHQEIDEAFTSAQKSFKKWASFSVEKRLSFIHKFSEIISNKKEQLARLISLETGKPLWESKTEVSAVINKIQLSINAFNERTSTQEIDNNETKSYIRYKPYGTVAVLGPFNFPAHLSNGHIIPALIAGNTIILKPSELTPMVAEFVVNCWHEANLEPGVLNLVQGNAKCAQYLLSKNVNGVYFTGSFKTGVLINKQFAMQPGVILALEMGGNNPLVIEKVEDLKGAIYTALLSSFITAGQRCSCARRIIIPNNSFGENFLEQFIKSAAKIKIGSFDEQPEPFIGPVIRNSHALNHLKAQQKLIDSGADSLLEMSLLKEDAAFLSPGIVDVTNIDNTKDDEIFAPFVQIYKYNDFDEALAIANQTNYGLVAALISDNKNNFQEFFNTVKAGIINWNKPTTGASSRLPFGGVKHSGNNRPSGYFAADYCSYPIASLEQKTPQLPKELPLGITL